MMNECVVCKATIEEGVGACPICGFPVLRGIGNTEADKEQIENMAKLYLKKFLNEYKFGLKQYEYDLENGALKYEGENEILFTNNGEFPIKVEQEFYNKDLDAEMDIQIFAEHTSGNKKTYDLKIKNPNVEGGLYVWLEMTRELKVCLKVGNENKHEVSEEIALLELKG